MTTAPSSPKMPEPSVETCIVTLVAALQQSKGWLHDYADSIVRDAVDRAHLMPNAQSALLAQAAEIAALKADAEHYRRLFNASKLGHEQAFARCQELSADAERYQLLRRGQKWSVIDGSGDTLRAEDLDASIDSVRALAQQEAKS